MKKTYHLCLSAGDEVLFRDLEDYNRGFNYFALALYKTGSTGLVESFMSTHTHQLVQTVSPTELMYHFRLPYSMYFNRKYHRRGKLGEELHFTMEVVGYNHMIAAASYTLRNALHHGVAPIPYAYPHCSANAIFMKEMGKQACNELLDRRHYRQHIGKTAEFPDSYKMNASGVFLRETVLDIPQVESLYVTPRSFNWHMTRKWFISRFSLAANKDVAEHIAGHEGYLSVSYRRYTKKQIIKEYIKAEKKLSIIKDRE